MTCVSGGVSIGAPLAGQMFRLVFAAGRPRSAMTESCLTCVFSVAAGSSKRLQKRHGELGLHQPGTR